MRLEELKRQRIKDGEPNGSQKLRAKQQQKQQKQQNTTQKPGKKTANSANNNDSDEEDGPQSHQSHHNASKKESNVQDELIESMADVEYSSFTANTSRQSGETVNYGKPGSKMLRLKRLLDDAESKRRRLEVLNASGEEGKAMAISEQWSEALKDASGEKTTSAINVNKVRKAIKKKEKGKEKSAREWAVSTSASNFSHLF
jgi:hypothetical protein